jgi:hypothetical protein
MEIAGLVFTAVKSLVEIGISAYQAKQKNAEELQAEIAAVFAELKAKIDGLPAAVASNNAEADEALKKKFQTE